MGCSSGVQPLASGAKQVLLLLEKLDSKDLKTNQPNKQTNKQKQTKTKQNKKNKTNNAANLLQNTHWDHTILSYLRFIISNPKGP